MPWQIEVVLFTLGFIGFLGFGCWLFRWFDG